MRDRLFFPLLGLIAAGLVALALAWPRGAGAPAAEPFQRHPPPSAGSAPKAVAQARPGVP